MLPKLNKARTNACAFVFKYKLYVFGGCVENKEKTGSVEFYSEKNKGWYMMNF